MKLLIEIPKQDYEQVKQYVEEGVFNYNGLQAILHKAIANGTPFEEQEPDKE